jgi:hypothetical protein
MHDSLSRLLPAVANFATPQFELGGDLRNLMAVQRIEALEAVVFYSSRILEALTAEAVRRLGQTPSANVFANLEMLWYWNRFGVATHSWAHALRRLGNQARHIGGRVGPMDAALAAAFAEGWLGWFFGAFSHGDRLPQLTVDGTSIVEGARADLLDWMRSLDQSVTPLASPTEVLTAVMPAVTAELLLSRKQDAAAGELLQKAITAFPNDLRLGQLLGLSYSRRQELIRALEILEPLRERNPDDEETTGILAGVYKRHWLADESHAHALRQAHRLYQSGWKRSARSNTYLGINAAATALWLGDRKSAQETAREVEQVLTKRAQSLPADLRDTQESFDYWDRVTLAEARLIQGDAAEAEKLYEAAFERHPELTGDIEVTRRQRERTVSCL